MHQDHETLGTFLIILFIVIIAVYFWGTPNNMNEGFHEYAQGDFIDVIPVANNRDGNENVQIDMVDQNFGYYPPPNCAKNSFGWTSCTLYAAWAYPPLKLVKPVRMLN